MKSYFYIIQYAHLFEQTDILKGSGNACLIDISNLLSGNIFSIQKDFSGIRFIDSGQKIEDGSLSGSVWSDQSIKLFLFDGNVKSVYRTKTTK